MHGTLLGAHVQVQIQQVWGRAWDSISTQLPGAGDVNNESHILRGEQWLRPLRVVEKEKAWGQGEGVKQPFSRLSWGQYFLQRSFTRELFVCPRHLGARLFSLQRLTFGQASLPGGRLFCAGDIISVSGIRVAPALSCNICKTSPGLGQIPWGMTSHTVEISCPGALDYLLLCRCRVEEDLGGHGHCIVRVGDGAQ